MFLLARLPLRMKGPGKGIFLDDINAVLEWKIKDNIEIAIPKYKPFVLEDNSTLITPVFTKDGVLPSENKIGVTSVSRSPKGKLFLGISTHILKYYESEMFNCYLLDNKYKRIILTKAPKEKSNIKILEEVYKK
jgi:hypothetical protein